MLSLNLPPDWTVLRVCDEFVKRRTNSGQCSYAAHLQSSEAAVSESVPSSPEPGGTKSPPRRLVAPVADVFVSYCWAYRWGELCDALLASSDSENGLVNKASYVWIDVFCVNQHHKEAVVDNQTLIDTFGGALQKIGRAVIVLKDWERPIYTSRIWCVFEAWIIVMNKVDYRVLVPAADERNLREAMSTPQRIDLNFVETYFSSINIERAVATEERDRVAILEKVRSSSAAATREVNDVVLRFLKEWLVRVGKSCLEEIEGNTSTGADEKRYRIWYSLGRIHRGLLDDEACLVADRESVKWGTKAFGEGSTEVAAAMTNLGRTLNELNRAEEALSVGESALRLKRAVFPARDHEIATSLNNVGNALMKLGGAGRHTEALARYREALEIDLEVYGRGKDSVKVANDMTLVGDALEALRRVDEALETQREALAMRVRVFGSDHVKVAESRFKVGRLLRLRGEEGGEEEKEEARKHLAEARAIAVRVHGENHPFTLGLLAAEAEAAAAGEEG